MGQIWCPLNISICSTAAVDNLLLIAAFENGICQSFYHFQQDPAKLIIMHQYPFAKRSKRNNCPTVNYVFPYASISLIALSLYYLLFIFLIVSLQYA